MTKRQKGSGWIMAIILILALITVGLLIKKTGLPAASETNNAQESAPVTEPEPGTFPTSGPDNLQPPTTLPPGN